jgi:broad specificity phosphatase PhoE
VSTTLLFVRHAEVHNPRDVVYGRLPRFGLSAKGREQAQRVADYLAADPIAAIYTSPLLRARQTAAAIAARHPTAPLRRSSLLIEILTGWQGTPNKEVPRGTSFYVTKRDPADEGAEEMLARLYRLVRWLLRRHRDQTVVCVSHADPIAALTLAAGGLEVTPQLLQKPLAPARTAITFFEYRSPDARPILSYVDPQPPEPHKHDHGAEKAAEQATASAEVAVQATASAVAQPGPNGAAATPATGAAISAPATPTG